jgi:hypothetical protein
VAQAQQAYSEWQRQLRQVLALEGEASSDAHATDSRCGAGADIGSARLRAGECPSRPGEPAGPAAPSQDRSSLPQHPRTGAEDGSFVLPEPIRPAPDRRDEATVQ